MKLNAPLITAAMAAVLAFSAPAKAVPVDLELSLVIDVSGSVDLTEYNLMMDGYANAFRDGSVQASILGGTIGSIAVNTVFFASSATVGTPFTLLNSNGSIDAFANLLDGFARPGGIGSSTDIADGIFASFPTFGSETGGGANGFESPRQVIDVSGDGEDNSGSSVTLARDAALAAGVDVINGIAIGGGASLLTYYQNNVIGGAGSFAILAANFADFETGIRTKLRVEIGGGGDPIPEPGTLALFGLGLAGIGFARRRKVA